MKKTISIFLLLMLLSSTSYADDKLCNLSIIYQYNETGIEGIGVKIYYIADVFENYGDYYYEIAEDWLGEKENIVDWSKNDFKDVNLDVSKHYENFSATTDNNGEIVIKDIPKGLYLVCYDDKYNTEYEPFKQFCISVPQYKDGEYIFDVNCIAKTTLAKKELEKPPTGDKANISMYYIYACISMLAFLILKLSNKKASS